MSSEKNAELRKLRAQLTAKAQKASRDDTTLDAHGDVDKAQASTTSPAEAPDAPRGVVQRAKQATPIPKPESIVSGTILGGTGSDAAPPDAALVEIASIQNDVNTKDSTITLDADDLEMLSPTTAPESGSAPPPPLPLSTPDSDATSTTDTAPNAFVNVPTKIEKIDLGALREVSTAVENIDGTTVIDGATVETDAPLHVEEAGGSSGLKPDGGKHRANSTATFPPSTPPSQAKHRPLSDPATKSAKTAQSPPIAPPSRKGTMTGHGALTSPFGTPVSGAQEAPKGKAPDPAALYSGSQAAHIVDAASPQAAPEPEGPQTIAALDTAAYYEREASAMGREQPDRAAAMWFEVACQNQRGGAADAPIEHALTQAANAAPSNAALIAQLRRFSLQRHDFHRALDLADRQVEAGGPNPTRVASLIESAAVARFESSDPRAALAILDRALDLAPADTLVLALASGLHLELGQSRAAVERLDKLTETLSSPKERARQLYTIASLLEGSLHQPSRALATYRRAFEADGAHVPALLGLCELSDELAEWSQLTRYLEDLATRVPGAAAQILARAGALYLDRDDNLDAAVRTLSAAANAAPEDARPLLRLAWALEARGSYADLALTLKRLDALTFDLDALAALRTRVGWIAENHLLNPNEAIDAYRHALQARPQYLPALQALGTLYRRNSDFEALLTILAPETEDDSPADRRAERSLEMAAILDRNLGRPQEAIERTQRALDIVPGAPLAFALQRRLLQRLDRYQELGTLLQGQIEASTDIKTRHHWLLELARLQAGPLDAPLEASKTYEQARKVPTNRSASLELVDLYEREKRWSDLVSLLSAEADDTRDATEAESYRLRAAAILDERLDEHDRALEILTQVLKDNPNCLAATRNSGRILDRLGRWPDLLALYGQQLERAQDNTHAATILLRMGRLQEEHLGDPKAAITTYRQALRRRPETTPALMALERLVRFEGRHEELIEVLQRHATADHDPRSTAGALCRAAEIADTQRNNPDEALGLYTKALVANPDDLTALYGTLSLHLRRAEHDAASASFEALVQAETAQGNDEARTLIELGKFRHQELRSPHSQSPEHIADALCASPFAKRLRPEILRLRRRAHDDTLATTLVEIAEETSDDDLAAALFLEAAQAYELREADDEQHLALASQAFAAKQNSPAIIWSLERALERTSQWHELAALLEREGNEEGEFSVRIPVLSAAATAYLHGGQMAEAARVARQCLSGDRHHLPSLLLLGRLAEEQRSWTELASYCDQIIAASQNTENRLNVALLASDTWAHRIDDTERALASLQPALSDDPAQAGAFARAERLLSQMENFEQLSLLYTRRINVSEDLPQKIEFLRLNAHLLRDRLGDSIRAIDELEQLLALAPRDVEALDDQAKLLQQHHRWSDAVATLSTLIEATDDPLLRRNAHITQANLLLRKLHEPQRARQILDRALSENPHDDELRKLLVEAHIAEGRWDAARRILEVLSGRPGEGARPLRVWALSHLAEIARTGLRDEGLRDHCDTRAIEMASEERSLLDALVARFIERGETGRLREITTRIVEESTNADAVAPLRVTLARLLLDRFGEADEALEQLRAALVVDPNHEEARLLLAWAMEEQGQTDAAAQGYGALLVDQLSSADAARGLARLMDMQGEPAIATVAKAFLAYLGEATQEDLAQIARFCPSGSPQGTLKVLALPIVEADTVTPVEDILAVESFLAPLLPHLGNIYKLPLGPTLGASHPAAAAARQIADDLDLASIQIAVEVGYEPATAGLGRPVPLRISPELAAAPNEAPFRFWVGRALGAAASAGALLELLDDQGLALMIEAFDTPKPINPAVIQQRKALLRALPRKLRKQIEQTTVPSLEKTRWQAYRALERQRADRIGLLISGNPQSTLEQLPKDDPQRLRRLLRFALSSEFGAFHRRLWTTS